MRHHEDRELVPLKSDFDVMWRGYRRSQVKFYVQQTETELRILTEDRDSALSQVADLTGELEEARAEIESLREQLDRVSREPVDVDGLSERMRRMVRLAHEEATEIVSSARATAEHEWARSEQAAAELRGRYEKLVADADAWRVQQEKQREEEFQETRRQVESMAKEAEQRRRRLDSEAEERRTKIEDDFEVSMQARREAEAQALAERDQASRDEAERRILAATAEAERRIRLADEHVAAMRMVRQDVAERVRLAQQMLTEAEPLVAASESGTDTAEAEEYAASSLRHGHVAPWADDAEHDVAVPRQRAAQADDETDGEVESGVTAAESTSTP